MKKFIKRLFPVLLAMFIAVSIGWYFMEYDPGFTRDLLLQQARRMEDSGNRKASVWLYNVAYDHFGGSDEIAIELANKFIEIGNYSKAEYTLRKAIEDGGNAELYMALSKTYVEQGKLRDAVLMLDNVGADMQAQLQALRPAAPQASYPSGNYRQYLSVEFHAPGYTIYVATDNDYPSGITDAYTAPIQLGLGQSTLFTVCVGENGLVSPLAVYSYIISDVVETVTFMDPGFDAAVRKALGYSNDRVIYSNNLWTITELDLGENVKSIADLKWVPNLRTLRVRKAVLDNAASLSGCMHLESISVTGSIVSTEIMQVIGSMPQLKTLRLSECGISSIAPLSGLTELTKLDLSSNAIRDITALAGLTKLTELNLSSNALIGLDGLETLQMLTKLDVSYNSIVSIAPLASMQMLQELNLSSNALRNLDSISGLVELRTLNASHNELLDLTALSGCQTLVNLDVSHNTLLSLDALSGLMALEVLDFSYNEVSKLPNFAVDCALRIIRGDYNQLASLKKLGGLKNLTHVYMDYNVEISSVSALASCPALKEVYVYGTSVRHISALTDLGILVVYSPV